MIRRKTWFEMFAALGLGAAMLTGGDAVEVRAAPGRGPAVTVEVVQVSSPEERLALAMRNLAEAGPFAPLAARYLARHQIREALPLLLEIAEGRPGASRHLREQAVRALGELGDRRAAPVLVDMAVDEGGGWLRVCAVEALVAMNREADLPPLAISGDEDLLRRAVDAVPHA